MFDTTDFRELESALLEFSHHFLEITDDVVDFTSLETVHILRKHIFRFFDPSHLFNQI